MFKRTWKKTDTSAITFSEKALLYSYGTHVGILSGEEWKCYKIHTRQVISEEIEEVCEEVDYIPMRALFIEETPIKITNSILLLPNWTITLSALPPQAPRVQPQAPRVQPQAQAPLPRVPQNQAVKHLPPQQQPLPFQPPGHSHSQPFLQSNRPSSHPRQKLHPQRKEQRPQSQQSMNNISKEQTALSSSNSTSLSQHQSQHRRPQVIHHAQPSRVVYSEPQWTSLEKILQQPSSVPPPSFSPKHESIQQLQGPASQAQKVPSAHLHVQPVSHPQRSRHPNPQRRAPSAKGSLPKQDSRGAPSSK